MIRSATNSWQRCSASGCISRISRIHPRWNSTPFMTIWSQQGCGATWPPARTTIWIRRSMHFCVHMPDNRLRMVCTGTGSQAWRSAGAGTGFCPALSMSSDPSLICDRLEGRLSTNDTTGLAAAALARWMVPQKAAGGMRRYVRLVAPAGIADRGARRESHAGCIVRRRAAAGARIRGRCARGPPRGPAAVV